MATMSDRRINRIHKAIEMNDWLCDRGIHSVTVGTEDEGRSYTVKFRWLTERQVRDLVKGLAEAWAKLET